MYRATILLTLLVTIALTIPAEAVTGIGLGVRGGSYTKYDNEDLEFQGYPIIEIDNLTMLGGHIRISTLPVFTYELVGEYSWKKNDYTLETGHKATLKVRDFMVGANVKYKFKIPALRPYLGGGLGLHHLTYELEISGPGLEEISIPVPADGSQLGVHGIIGLELSFPASPIEVFLEGRLGRISGDEGNANFTMIYGGITLKML